MLVAAMLLGPGAAQAMLAPCYYDAMIRDAAIAVQIADLQVGAPDEQGYCEVAGTVYAVLHGDIAVGDSVTFAAPCEWDGSVGGTIWTDAAVLAASPAAELHLDAAGAVAGYGFGLILLPSVTGQMVWKPVTTETC